MAYKNTFPASHGFLLFIILSMLIVSFSFAQEDAFKALPAVEEEKDYYIKETSEGFVFIQKLTWDEVAYGLSYDVVIEKQDESGLWESFDTISTDVNILEVSLFAGKYRYKVLVYNVLDMIEIELEWFEFDVFRATQPQLESFSPKLIPPEEIHTGLFTIVGDNLSRDTIFSLEIPGDHKRTLMGIVKKDDKNGEVEVQFDINAINTNSYTLIAKNPGGLTAKAEVQFDIDAFGTGDYALAARDDNDIAAKKHSDLTDDNPFMVKLFKPYTVAQDHSDIAAKKHSDLTGDDPFMVNLFKPYDFNITAGYVATWIPPDGNISRHFDKSFFPLGFNVRFTYIPVKKRFGYFGVELAAYWIQMTKELSDHTISTNIFPLNLNFVYQLPLIKGRLVLDTHIGLGVTFFHNLEFKIGNFTSPRLDTIGLSANAGIALQIYIIKGLYVEVGADYILAFPKNTMFHMVLPSASVGWQF